MSTNDDFRNRALRALPGRHVDSTKEILFRTKWSAGDVLMRAGTLSETVLFPEHGLTVLFSSAGKKRLGVGAVGREGMLYPTSAVLDRKPRFDAVAMTPGDGYRLHVGRLRELLEDSRSLQMFVHEAAASLQELIASTAVANGLAPVDQRLARWLLMCGDRIGETFNVSHEVLAEALGVRRPGVTDAIHGPEGRGFIRSRRMEIEIVDRSRLQAFAEPFYDGAEVASAHPERHSPPISPIDASKAG